MAETRTRFTVFTKYWKVPVPELGAAIKKLGFDGIELPVRPGFQVEHENVERDLPEAAKVLAGFGLEVASIAPLPETLDEKTLAACAEAGVPIIRTLYRVQEDEDYFSAEARVRKQCDALVPLLDRYSLTLAIQNHCNRFIGSSIGIRRLIENYDPKRIAAVWDPAHCAVAGEMPELALDILWSHLRIVNLKNFYWKLREESAPDESIWELSPCTGREGLASWPLVAGELKKRDYSGIFCLSADYSDEATRDQLVAEDIKFAKSLFG